MPRLELLDAVEFAQALAVARPVEAGIQLRQNDLVNPLAGVIGHGMLLDIARRLQIARIHMPDHRPEKHQRRAG